MWHGGNAGHTVLSKLRRECSRLYTAAVERSLGVLPKLRCAGCFGCGCLRQLWYALGMHVGTVQATKTFTAADGDLVVVWDLSDRIPKEQQRIPLCLSSSFIFCFGMTSTTGTSVVSEIGFYSEEELPHIGTGIHDVAAAETTATPGPVYNLQGIQMPDGAQLPAGVYIRNNKKFIVK